MLSAGKETCQSRQYRHRFVNAKLREAAADGSEVHRFQADGLGVQSDDYRRGAFGDTHGNLHQLISSQ